MFKSITAKLGDWKSKHKQPEAEQSSSSNVAAVGLAGELGVGEVELRTGKLDALAGLCVASGQRFAAIDVGNAAW